jgi:hypothetical protein
MPNRPAHESSASDAWRREQIMISALGLGPEEYDKLLRTMLTHRWTTQEAPHWTPSFEVELRELPGATRGTLEPCSRVRGP